MCWFLTKCQNISLKLPLIYNVCCKRFIETVKCHFLRKVDNSNIVCKRAGLSWLYCPQFKDANK